jgi:hypothetical protein
MTNVKNNFNCKQIVNIYEKFDKTLFSPRLYNRESNENSKKSCVLNFFNALIIKGKIYRLEKSNCGSDKNIFRSFEIKIYKIGNLRSFSEKYTLICKQIVKTENFFCKKTSFRILISEGINKQPEKLNTEGGELYDAPASLQSGKRKNTKTI